MPFSAKRILIFKLNEFRYLPLGPLKNCLSASLKEVCVSMANSVTNGSRVRVVQKSTALDTALLVFFKSLILSGVQLGD